MDVAVTEVTYPVNFREEDAKKLGEHIRNRHSVEMIGMKRVGISNFLRFFLYHKDIVTTYISKEQKFLYIPVDLNDLIEREIYPFWSLTLKRIVDTVERSYLPRLDKEKIQSLFLTSIQSQDLFLTIDSVRRAVVDIVATGVHPTFFFLRFDRMKEVVTPQFFDNLQGLKDATHQQLSYVFTSYRSLDELSPNVFTKASVSVFAHPMYLKPASEIDMQAIYQTFNEKYAVSLIPELEEALFEYSAGYVQYLQLGLIILSEKKNENSLLTKDELFELLTTDERILLQSEEIYDSLTKNEKDILGKVVKAENLTDDAKKSAKYLWDTGIIEDTKGADMVFSPLLAYYLKKQLDKHAADNKNIHMTKKENTLFELLKEYKDEICERDVIVEKVWPEYKEFGVSDWAIDRLVARVRVKVKQQGSKYEIVTIRTRGYKLTDNL